MKAYVALKYEISKKSWWFAKEIFRHGKLAKSIYGPRNNKVYVIY